MLGGGDKSTQQQDIDRAVKLSKTWRIKMVKVADLPSFDMAESLKTEEDIVMYLNMVLEENDPAELAHALGVIAKARGMTQIAKEAGIGREALYKALRHDSAPRFDTINRVVNALGLKLTAQHA
jgi:probable addiction module antidote protein